MKRERGGFWVWFAAAFFYPLCTILARRRNWHRERIPRTGGALVVMNHVSHLDPMFDSVFIHKAGRLPAIMAKDSLFKKGLVGAAMRGSGQIPVYRDSVEGAKESLRLAGEALANGKVVIIYPEGTITRDPAGWPMHPRTGVARLALASDQPVIPAARWGTLDILNAYERRFRPFPRHDVNTIVGEPIDLSEFRGRPVTSRLLREVTDVLMREVTALVAELRGEPAPAEPFRPAAADGRG